MERGGWEGGQAVGAAEGVGTGGRGMNSRMAGFVGGHTSVGNVWYVCMYEVHCSSEQINHR